MTDLQKSLSHEYNAMVKSWITEHNLSCEHCKNHTTKTKDGCSLKVNCVVKHGYGLVMFDPKDE